MDVELRQVTVRDLTDGYVDSGEDGGVVAYNGELDVRPVFQREFVYNPKQRDEVMFTLLKGFPLNVMYWATKPDGGYDLIDGQQRTLSICQYVNGDYAIDSRYFHNLTDDEQATILDYELMIYECTGTDSEKLGWFQTINIAGEKLTDQELLNAIYTGPWLTDAKRYFSRNKCAAYGFASIYMNGTPIRQDYLATVLAWINNGDIRKYMATHQHDENAAPLWTYFQNVINWAKTTFPTYRKEMKGLPWGMYYNQYHNNIYNSTDLDTRTSELMQDDDITKPSGIYHYLLSGDEKWLQVRAFTSTQKRVAYEKQDGICIKCDKPFPLDQMEADHITPWSQGGKTIPENCQLLCKACNRKKSDT